MNGNEAFMPNGSVENGGGAGTSGPVEAVPEPWNISSLPNKKSSSKVGWRGGRAKAKNKKKNASPSLIANWERIDDGGVCNVCFDSQSYDENPIMRCDSCKVAVHQHCYGCRAGPQDGSAWFCDPCSNGENTSMLACSLCAETGVRGGAMKMVTPGVERSRSWVHVCCTMWIPEVFVGSDELEPVHLEYVPKDRKTLKCVLCGKRGVCVQCAGGRCLVAYHPWCLLHTDKNNGLLFRSLDTKGNLNVYCRKHIGDIKVPLDLPEKDSQLGPQSYKEARERISPKMLVYVPVPQMVPGKGGKSGRAGANGKQGGGSKNNTSKKRGRVHKGPGIIDVEGGVLGIQNHPLAKPQAKPQHLPLVQNPGRKRRKKFGPSPDAKNGQVEEPPSVEREAALMDTKDKDVDEKGNLVLHTFWDKAGAPRIGQDAGMTTDRFWEVTSAQFPEDHKEGWLRKLVDIEHLPKDNDKIFVVPEPKKKEETAKQAPASKDPSHNAQDPSHNAQDPSHNAQDPSPPEDEDSSDGSSSSGDEIQDVEMELEDEEDYDDSANSNPQKNGKGKTPTRGSRCSARLGGGSSDVPLGDPKVVDEEFKKIEGHHQTGVLLQKGDLRAGCRFGLRLVRDREDFDSLRKEEKTTGIEWMKYEQPWPDGFRQNPNTFPFPGLLKAGDGSSMGEVSGGVTDALSPAVTANGAPEASQSGGPIDVDLGGSDVLCEDGDDDLGDIYVALQGWIAHAADDPEIRLRHRGYTAEGALQSSAGAGALQRSADEGALQSPAGGGALQSPAGKGSLQSPAARVLSKAQRAWLLSRVQQAGALQSSAGEGALQSSAGASALQSSGGKGALQGPAGEGALQSSGGAGALQSSAGEGALQSSAGASALQSSGGAGALQGPAGEGALQSSGGAGALQSSGGEGALQSPAGEGAFQSSAGAGALQSSAGAGALQSSGGEGALQSPGGEGALQSSAGAGALQSSGGEGALQSPAGEGALQSPAGESALQSPAGEGALQSPAGEGALQSSGVEGALQSSGGEGALQSPAGEGALQSSAGAGALQSSGVEGALQSSGGEGALQSSAGAGALQGSGGEGACEGALQSPAGEGALQSSAGAGALQSSAGEGALQSPAGEGALQSSAGAGALQGSGGEGADARFSALSEGYPLPALMDDVTELLGSMQAKLKEITNRSRCKVDSIIERSEPEVSAAADFRQNSDRLFKRLGRVQSWKTLYHKMEFGVADRPQNFNQTDASVVLDVPASWGRNAEGRQSKEEFEAQMRAHVEAANKEDAVCMVCFDGTTDDNKDIQIVYCDGCGMSVHQHCYGVKDVEADFCCERCRELRNIEQETGSADPEAVRCAICPVIHGALKRTCGNQWAHMACMLTIPGARMDDLINKTQIDLSEVHVDPHIVPPLLQFPADAPQLQQLAEQASLSHSLISHSLISSVVDVYAPGGDGATTSASLSALETAAASNARATWEGAGSSGFGAGGEPSAWQALVQAHAQQAALGFHSGGMGVGAASVDQAGALVSVSSAAVDSAEEVDVSAPSPSYVRPKTPLLPPRSAPERELACCICFGTDGSLLDCGITECGAGGGGVLRHGEGPALCGAGGVDGNQGDGIAVCGKRFHFLCAWFAGAYVKVSPTDPSFTRGERGLSGNMNTWPPRGQPRFGFPTGMAIEARCLEHSVGAPGRRGAPPGLARVVTPVGSGGGLAVAETFVEDTTFEEQAQLRSKYRFKGHPEWQLEGTKRKKSKGQLKKEDKKAEREKQQSSMRLSKPRALPPDKYERFACAVCMKSRQPLLGFRKEAETGEASSGGAAGSGATAEAPPAELSPDLVQCSTCGVRVHRKCYGVPEDIGKPGAVSGDQWFCVPCSSRVSEPNCTLCPRKGGAFVRIRGAHYCHAFCAERTPGSRLVDPLAAVEALETAARSEEALTAEGGTGTRKTGGKASKAKGCSTSKAKMACGEDMDAVDVGDGDGEGEEGASAGGGGTWSKKPAHVAVAGKVPRGGGAASGAGTGVGKGKAASVCAKTAETKGITKGKAASPCAKTADTKGIPKELKKSNNKCHICSRKGGVVVQCSYGLSPCERWMHPMCAAQNSGHSRRLSPEEAEATRFKSLYAFVCNDHVAACLRLLSSGHWLDFLSLYRMRAELDRARVLFDCVLRREKIKRQLHRTSSDLFDTTLAHLRASAIAGAQALRERLDNINAAAATATEVAAAAAAAAAAAERGDVGSGARGRAAVSRAREEADAAAAAAATAEAARTAAATRVSARGSSKKGGETKIVAAIESVPWYGKYSLVEDNALTLPENPEMSYRPKMARAGDLGSSEFGRVRKKTLKAEEADGLKAGATDARRVFTAADSRKGGFERKGVSSGGGKGDIGRSGRGGGGGGDRSIAEGGVGDKRKHSSGADGGREKWPVISSAPAKRRKALWAPGKRPLAGREGSHALSKAAAEKLVDSCVESLPLQGIAASLLERKGGTSGCSRAFPGHFGGLFKKLVGSCNVEPLMKARKAHKEAHPGPHREIPGLASPQQLLRDRQLKELCDTICEFRVEKEEGDPRWESGRAKPDDGKRDLGELFDEAPSRDSYPEYYAKVSTVMDLKTVKNKVLEHKYAGIDDLVQDIAVMYSNAQAIEHAQATKDAERMLGLAQRIAQRLRDEEREGKAHRQTKLEEPEESPAASRPPHIFCAKCDRLRAQPSGKALPLDIRKESYWFCDACVSASPETLTGHRIGVFWDGPGKWLAATINGYEPLSGKHKIVYWVDGHWEFVSLGSRGSRISYHHPQPPRSLALSSPGAKRKAEDRLHPPPTAAGDTRVDAKSAKIPRR